MFFTAGRLYMLALCLPTLPAEAVASHQRLPHIMFCHSFGDRLMTECTEGQPMFIHRCPLLLEVQNSRAYTPDFWGLNTAQRTGQLGVCVQD